MSELLITYDLNNEIKRPNILASIKALGPWAKLSESSYAVVTAMTPAQVFQHLQKHLDSDDTCYVITLRKPYAGRGPQDVNKWLEDNLRA